MKQRGRRIELHCVTGTFYQVRVYHDGQQIGATGFTPDRREAEAVRELFEANPPLIPTPEGRHG